MLRRPFASASSLCFAAMRLSASPFAAATSSLFSTGRTSVADYKSALDFDPMGMKWFCEGTETEMKEDTRRVAIAAVTQHKLTTSNRSVERETSILRDRCRFMLNPPPKILSDRQDKTAAHSDNFLVSLAQYRTTPAKFQAMYEATAMIDAQLAYALASHFSLASCIASVYRPHISAITSGNVDTGAAFFTGAHQEVLCDDAPYQTVCHLDRATGMLRVSTRQETGGGKIIHVLGSSARYAVVSVQFMAASGTMSPHLVLLELRDASGKLRPGVSMKGLGSTGGAVDGLASCVLHLEDVLVPVESLLSADLNPEDGNMVPRDASLDAASEMFDAAMKKSAKKASSSSSSKDDSSKESATEKAGEDDADHNNSSSSDKGPLATNAMLNVATSQRLAIASMSLGKCKRMLHDLVRFAASKKVLGPTGERDHPNMGLHVVQRRVSSSVAKVLMLNAVYQRVVKTFTTPSVANQLNTEDFVELAAVTSELVELQAELGKLGAELCGWQSTMVSSGFAEGIALASMWREGTSPDYVRFLYSRECIENSIGLLKSVSIVRHKLLGNSRLSHFMSNPFFSPTTNDMNRYMMLFGEKELQTRTALQGDLRVAQRKGAEDMFYVWNNEQQRAVLSHSDAYFNVLALKTMTDVLHKSRDPYNTRMLNDVAWLWCLLRIEGDLQWYVRNNAIKPRQIRHMEAMIDNLCNLISHQAVHIVDCFGIPRMELESPLPRDWEAYWAPPKKM